VAVGQAGFVLPKYLTPSPRPSPRAQDTARDGSLFGGLCGRFKGGIGQCRQRFDHGQRGLARLGGE